MSLARLISITHDCEFTQEYPSMVHNHIEIHTGCYHPQKQHITSIKEYAKQLVGIKFYGQTTLDEDTDYYDNESENLGTVMNEMYTYIKITEEYLMADILVFVKKLAKYRKQRFENENECYERLKIDTERFLNIFKTQEPTDELYELHYWGTRQQLLAGKVIADWVDAINGPMDPIFGAMLTPTAGRVGPGNSCVLHCLLFDNDGKFAYHSAIHDAFGFLKKFHNIGPGYDYLNWKILGRMNMFAGQITGLLFWKFANLEEKKNVLYLLQTLHHDGKL